MNSVKDNLLMPRESGKFIAESAKHVTLNNDGIKRLASMVS
jgi:hypothetical protein